MTNENKKLDVNRKKQILEEATRLFFEQGYDNTSIKDITNFVDISVAGIYYYFTDKKEILFTIMDESVTSLRDTLSVAINETDPAKANILRIIENLVSLVVKNLKEIGLLVKEDHRLSADQLTVVNKKRRQCFEIIKNEIARLEAENKLKPVNLTSSTFTLIAMTNYLYFWYDPERSLTAQELAQEIAEIFLQGIMK